MTNITVFEFDAQEIEVVVIDEQPWFHASQVAKALGYTNPSKSLHDNVSAKYNQQLDLGRRGSNPNFISEPGLYQLIMRSTLPSAQRFQDWVFEEVLPAIRKQGSYSITPAEPKLPPADVRINELRQSMQFFDIDVSNPRYKQAIQDLVLNKIVGANALPSGEQEVWCGVAERAEELGYPVRLVTKYRSTLGKFVKAFDLESKQEKRLCNGTQREISLYKVTGELDSAIKEYMDAKILAS